MRTFSKQIALIIALISITLPIHYRVHAAESLNITENVNRQAFVKVLKKVAENEMNLLHNFSSIRKNINEQQEYLLKDYQLTQELWTLWGGMSPQNKTIADEILEIMQQYGPKSFLKDIKPYDIFNSKLDSSVTHVFGIPHLIDKNFTTTIIKQGLEYEDQLEKLSATNSSKTNICQNTLDELVSAHKNLYINAKEIYIKKKKAAIDVLNLLDRYPNYLLDRYPNYLL